MTNDPIPTASGILLHWPDDGTLIGMYDICRCGSGRRFRDCCVAFVTSTEVPSPFGIGLYVMFTDLWPRDKAGLDKALSQIIRFTPQELVQTLARINVCLHDQYMSKHNELELDVLKLFLPHIWYVKTERWITSHKRDKVLHAPLLPGLIVRTMASAPGSTCELSIAGSEGHIGVIALTANQALEDDYQSLKSQASSSPEAEQMLCASLYRQASVSHQEEYGDSLARMWCLVTKGFPAGKANKKIGNFDFEIEFYAAFGFLYRDMFAYGFALLTQYSSVNKDLFAKPEGFALNRQSFAAVVPPARRVNSELIFDYLSQPWDLHVAESQANTKDLPPGSLAQLSGLYDHPLVEMPTGLIFALDTEYLRARIAEGAYWALFNHLKDCGREAELREAFGHATEWYATELLRETCSGGDPRILWLDSDGDFSGDNAKRPDAILRNGETLYFIEITTSSPTVRQSTSGDYHTLAAALKKIWFGEAKGDSAKLTQLAGAITDFERGALRVSGLMPSEIAHIHPVLVTLRNVPQWPVLLDWYRDLMRAEGMTEEFARDILMIDMDELESLTLREVVREGWSTILAQRRLSIHPDTNMRNFIRQTGRAQELHPFLIRALDEVRVGFAEVFPNFRPASVDSVSVESADGPGDAFGNALRDEVEEG